MTIARMPAVTAVSSQAERFFGGHASLPVMPEVGRKLLRSLDDDGVSLGQIAELIGNDTAARESYERILTASDAPSDVSARAALHRRVGLTATRRTRSAAGPCTRRGSARSGR